MKNIKLYEDFINEKKPKGAPDFHHSDAPDAEGRFRDLSPKKLAAWLIKTRNKDLKKISGSLTQQVVFNRNEDPEYADKMERTRKEVYKQLGREDLLDNMKESLNERDTLAELHEMTLGQLERIEDYAEMIAERMEGGQELESWMFSQITVALDNLNAVHDAMDGVDGVDESEEPVNEKVLLIMKDVLSKMVGAGFSYKTNPKMRNEIQDAISKAITPILKDYGYAIQESFDDEEDDRGPIDELNKHVKNIDQYIAEKTDYQYKQKGPYQVEATVCYLDPMTRQRKCKKIYFKSKFDALGFKGNVKGFPKGAAVEAIRENEVTELRTAHAGSTSAAFWHELEDRKYELKKPVKGVNIGNHSKVTLPKGTIIHNLPGGLFAKHEDLVGYKSYNNNDKFGVLIKKDYQVLQDIEKNSKVLESLVIEKAKGNRGPLDNPDIEVALKKKSKESGIDLALLRIVMRRGMDAWNSGHRPGMGQEQWGYARVNSFIDKEKGTWGGADKDVAAEVK